MIPLLFALTGLKGVGKSTLAAQIFYYAEERRLRGDSPFSGETLWLRIEPTSTMKDLLAAVAKAPEQPPRAFGQLASHQQQGSLNFDRQVGLELFELLTQNSTPRLIILDQCEEWFDAQTGRALEQHAALGEWLDLINTHACSSRILLTAFVYPQGTRISHPMYLREVHLDGLTAQEGTSLLRLWGVQGTEKDLMQAVELCRGHALALMLLEQLVRCRHVKLASILNDSDYQQLWMKDVQHNLLDYLYTYLLRDETLRHLLQAVAIYREAVPWQAIHVVMQGYEQTTEAHTLATLGVLQQYDLLQIHHASEERYALHPLAADFVREQRDSAERWQQAHLEAAHYYERASEALPIENRQPGNRTYMLVEAV